MISNFFSKSWLILSDLYISKSYVKIVFKLIVLYLILFCFDRLFVSILNPLSLNSSGGNLECNIVLNLKPDIIILGASRAKHHYVSSLISSETGLSTYNLGVGGTSVLLQYAQLRTILKTYKPKLIIYEVYGDDFSKFFIRPSAIAPLKEYASDRSIRNLMLLLDKEYVFKSFFKLYSYNGTIFTSLASYLHRQELINNGGYQPMIIANLPQLLKSVKPKDDMSIFHKRSKVLEVVFNDLLNLASQTNLNLLFLRSPFFHNQKSNISVSVDPLVKQAIKRHGFSFIDINDRQYPEFNNPLIYKDYVHLTDTGAREYTTRIIPIIKKQLEARQIQSFP